MSLLNKLLNKFLYDTCSCSRQKLKTATECNDCYRAGIVAQVQAERQPVINQSASGWIYTRQYAPEYYSTTYSSVQQPISYVTTWQAQYNSSGIYYGTPEPQPEIIHASTHSPDTTTEPIPEGRKIII